MSHQRSVDVHPPADAWGPLGATLGDDGVDVVLWAPHATQVELVLVDSRIAMEAHADGYHTVRAEGVGAGARYGFSLDGGEVLADPATRSQPDGVHGWSEVVAAPSGWTDGGWTGIAMEDLVLYELHVGTFTPAGTFDAVIDHLPRLLDVGINAIELMPIAQFPGERNWGYDGIFPFAAQHSYGGSAGLARLVDAAHAAGMAVLLDVVHNHIGPEGNRLDSFGPYFTDQYATPWGPAINVAGRHSDAVRRFFIESAVWWVRDHHLDGLRLDAVHAIVDPTARPFLAQLTEAMHGIGAEQDREVVVIAESSDNDPRLVRSPDQGGIGCDGIWNDDWHHAVRVALTGDRSGYYADYAGVPDLGWALDRKWLFEGRYSIARGRSHGTAADDVPFSALVVCDQNHDQVGNRAAGERLDVLVGLEERKFAAAATTLSPYTPMLFMGEEYGEQKPFPYFVDHHDPALLEAVRVGRREEFDGFEGAEVPDPASVETFRSAVLDPSVADGEPHVWVTELYRRCLAMRRTHRAIRGDVADHRVDQRDAVIRLHRSHEGDEVLVVFNAGNERESVPLPEGVWRVEIDTASGEFGGPADARQAAERIEIELWPWSVVALRR